MKSGGRMRAYLVRHGRANQEDPNRGLTEAGRDGVQLIGRFLHSLGATVSLIQHSGKRRAEETAHLLAENVLTTSGPHYADGLAPDDEPSVVANFLKVYTDNILIVGHLPHLERLTSLLLTGNENLRPVQFPNAGLVCLEKNAAGVWTLLWAVTPELLGQASTRAS